MKKEVPQPYIEIPIACLALKGVDSRDPPSIINLIILQNKYLDTFHENQFFRV